MRSWNLAKTAILCTVSLACSRPPQTQSLLSLVSSDGRALAKVLPKAETVLLLVYDPADCFSCGTPIGAWRTWESEAVGRAVSLVLTRPPSPMERQKLLASRFEPLALLENARAYRTPAAFQVIAGHIRDSGFGAIGIASLKRRMTPSIASNGKAP